MKLNINQLKEILKNKGASLEFTTGEPTTKKGFIVSLEGTETRYKLKDYKNNMIALLNDINDRLQRNTYNAELNKGHLLGFWIDKGVLFMDVSKCIKATKKDVYKVKNEALINNQYAVYNTETGKTYNLIIPVYTLYNTNDLINEPTGDLFNYSKDFYSLQDLMGFLKVTKAHVNDYIFSNIDEVQDAINQGYNHNITIIRDTTNYTRDLLEEDATLTTEKAFNLSRLLEAV